MDDADTAVLEALRDDVLRPEVLTQAVDSAVEAVASRDRLSHLERQSHRSWRQRWRELTDRGIQRYAPAGSTHQRLEVGVGSGNSGHLFPEILATSSS